MKDLERVIDLLESLERRLTKLEREIEGIQKDVKYIKDYM